MDLAGKVAMVTGTRRIGRAVGVALGERGADVAFLYHRSRVAAESGARQIESAGRRALVVRADLSSPREVEIAVTRVIEALGGIDILVNLASVYERRSLMESDAPEWDANMNVNARSALLCARAAIPNMRRRGGGRIVNFADWLPVSRRPRYEGFASYYASKAALVALSEAMALELAKDGILVNVIAPGPILPHDGITPEEDAEVVRNTPLGRWGGEESIVQSVLALLACDFVTGEVLRVDGGRHLL
jgi:3-oxoacyl-[acyl-carrier protein] reductase